MMILGRRPLEDIPLLSMTILPWVLDSQNVSWQVDVEGCTTTILTWGVDGVHLVVVWQLGFVAFLEVVFPHHI